MTPARPLEKSRLIHTDSRQPGSSTLGFRAERHGNIAGNRGNYNNSKRLQKRDSLDLALKALI
jgi:hypothetical protein